MATEIIGTGEDYTTPQGWESFYDGTLTEMQYGLLKSEEFDATVEFDGSTTTASLYMHLSTQDGAEFDHTDNSGAEFVVSGTPGIVISIKDFYTRVGGNIPGVNGSSPGTIGITGSSSATVYGVKFRNAGSNRIEHIIVHDLSSTGGNAFAIADDGSNSGALDCFGCAALNISTTASGGDAAGIATYSGVSELSAFYCAVDTITANSPADDAHGFFALVGTYNCWGGNISANDQVSAFSGIGTTVTCASDDSTASSGLQNLVRVDQFVLAGSDYHLKAGADLIDAGTDSYSWNWDVNGVVSGARDDIGIHEYITAGGTTINATTEALALTVHSTTVNAETSVQSTVDTLALTTYQASIAVSANVNVTTDSLTLVGYANSIALDKSVQATTNALVITANAASILLVTGTNVLASTDNLAITEYIATVNAANNIQAAYDVLELTSYTCSITTTTLNDRISSIEDYLSAGPITDVDNFILEINDGSLTMYYKEGNYHVI